MTPSSPALKPCPLCDGAASIHKETLDERYAYANRVQVQCNACSVAISAVGDTSKPGYADNSTTEQRAIAAWNRREGSSTSTSQAAAGDALKDAQHEIKLLELSLKVMTARLNELVGACAGPEGGSTAPPMKVLQRVRGFLPDHYSNSYAAKKGQS